MKPNNPALAVIVILIFLTLENGFSQQNNIRFKRLTINDGLSLSSVYTVFQDKKGFMWFGTEDGLNKYDGKRFRIYRPIPGESNSLSYKWIELIFEDNRGQLWFGSKGGLTRLNPEKDYFTKYYNFSTLNKLTSDTVTCLAEDNEHQLWIGTTSGLNQVDLESNAVTATFLNGERVNVIKQIRDNLWIGTYSGLYIKSKNDEAFQSVLIEHVDSSNLVVQSIVLDSSGSIWTGIGDRLFNIQAEAEHPTLSLVFSKDQNGGKIQQIEELIIDAQNNVWIGSSDGLFKLDPGTGHLSSIIKSVDSSHSLAINASKSLVLDQSGLLWYGTFGDGVFRIDTKTSRLTNFRNSPGDLQSLSEDAINCIYEDRNGDVWFGTFGAGINIYQPQTHKFGFLSHQPFNPNSLSSNFIWSVMECDDQKLWIGTNDAGLTIYDPVGNRFQLYDHRPNVPSSLSHSSVRKVYQDSKKRIWIGTDGGGLNRFFPESGRFKHYKNIPGDPTSISSNSVRVIYEDRSNRLWVGTRSGLNLFNTKNGTFKRFMHDEANDMSISNDFIYSVIYHDAHDNLWIGTYGGGLNKMDMKSGNFQHFIHDPSNNESLSDNIVFSIYEDPEDILWIGTNSGLNRLDLSNRKFQHFGIREGLPNEVIYGILADERDNLWLSTNKGICRFSLIDYSAKNFSVSDGLQSNEFNGGAFHKGISGMMYFGGVYGLNIVDPELGYINDNNSQVVITSLEILGKEVITSPDPLDALKGNHARKVNDNYYMPMQISYAEEIILDYEQRSFSIEYAALNNTNSDNLRFQYLIDGLDNDWNDMGTRNFVSFANMQPGEYSLRVRSINSDGFEGLSSAHLGIIINPPFWRTWWFYLIEILLIATLLTFIYKYLLKIRTNRLLIIQNERIFHANQKLQESENSLKQLNATKDKFFSIISHDLKNPFTSLLSISELLSQDYKEIDEEDKELGIKKIYGSAKRIYQLLENLLTWSRSQSGRIDFKPAMIDLKELIKDSLKLHEDLALKKNLNLKTQLPDVIQGFCDRDMVSAVLRNLLSNAIKFSKDGQRISIAVEDSGATWKISIIDQGVGISRENQAKVFRIDTKFKTEGTSGEKGTGLGLIICKEFVERNGGTISISSKEGKGSIFGFTVPKKGGFVG